MQSYYISFFLLFCKPKEFNKCKTWYICRTNAIIILWFRVSCWYSPFPVAPPMFLRQLRYRRKIRLCFGTLTWFPDFRGWRSALVFSCLPHHFSVFKLYLVGARRARWDKDHYCRSGLRDGAIQLHLIPWAEMRMLLNPPALVVHPLLAAYTPHAPLYLV